MIYRILSLDGGGAWALIQVKTLMTLFGDNATGHDVLASFDLVAANSGGSLTLAGLAENKRISEILDMFKDEAKRRSIFSPTRSPLRPLYKLIGLGPKYSAAAKLAAIRKLLPVTGDQKLPRVAGAISGVSGLPVHLLIVGFDYDTKRAIFFRSAEVKNRSVWGSGAPANCTLAEAVHVSTNAPIDYFDAPAAIPSTPDRFWDGGITGCNNPAVAATVEAITQDVAQTVERWEPPSPWEGLSWDQINTILDRINEGPSAGERYTSHAKSKDRYVVPVIVALGKRSDAQAKAVLKSWISNGVLVEETYDSPAGKKAMKGLHIDPAKRGEMKLTGSV